MRLSQAHSQADCACFTRREEKYPGVLGYSHTIKPTTVHESGDMPLHSITAMHSCLRFNMISFAIVLLMLCDGDLLMLLMLLCLSTCYRMAVWSM
jgi:hypothetical protein